MAAGFKQIARARVPTQALVQVGSRRMEKDLLKPEKNPLRAGVLAGHAEAAGGNGAIEAAPRDLGGCPCPHT